MTAVLISLIAVFVALGAVAMIVISRGKEIKLLAEDGIDVTGEVVDMPKFGRPTNARKYRHIRYRYRDAAGVEHAHCLKPYGPAPSQLPQYVYVANMASLGPVRSRTE